MIQQSKCNKSLLRSVVRLCASSVLGALLLGITTFGYAQQTAANLARITEAVNNTVLTTLKGNVHPLANAKFDHGAVVASMPMKRMLMVLKRSDVQEAALKTFLDQQQDKHSANYHQWLTPEQLGEKYGSNPADIKAITTWLQSQGFEIGSVSKSSMFIEFSGTAGQVANSLHTEIHSYVVNGELHYANASDPQIPSALAPVIFGFDSLNDFTRKPLSHLVGSFHREKVTGKVTPVAVDRPLFTFPASSTEDFYALGPYDLATIYQVLPLWDGSPALDGTGQTIAIVGRTDINPQDPYTFRTLFGLPTGGSLAAFQQQYLNMILNSPDPGNLGGGEEAEADIDVQWSGAVAKGALIDFVISETTTTTDGADLSALYIIDNNLAPVMSYSFGSCELALGTGGNQFLNDLWEQASAQGISAFVASGDEGSASCDVGSTKGASYGYAVEGNASTPYNVAVGGTDFDQFTNASQYWSATNNSTTQASAKGYVHETTWNNSCTNAIYSIVTNQTDPIDNCTNGNVQVNYGGLDIAGGSGGPSTCIISDGTNPSSCAGGYAKPSWQIGAHADKVRDVPDISLFASNGFAGSFYIICQADQNTDGEECNLNSPYADFQGYGGTSVASPATAGMFSILNQKLGARVGNPNYALYNLAAKEGSSGCDSSTGPGANCIFNDVTKGTISQPCIAGSLDCYTASNGDGYGVLAFDDGAGYGTIDSSGYPSDLAWNAAAGYDYGTGLGSLNANNLINQWIKADFLASTTILALSSTTFTHGTSIMATAKVSSNKGAPSGDVSFNGATTNGSIGYATLAGGTAQATLNSLPGGSYNVVAHYGGYNDGANIFAGSDSNPVAVTVAPEASTTTVTSVLYNVTNGNFTPGTTATYGAYYVIPRIDIAGASGNGVPTGTVTLTANGSGLAGSPFKLNSLGNAEDQNFSANAGVYAFSASYSGDPSFNTSGGTSTLTIAQQTPSMTLGYSSNNVSSGSSVVLSTTIFTKTYVGNAPTGTVTFYSGTTALGAPVSVTAGSDTNGFPDATASLTTPALAEGSYTVSVEYSGDVNYSDATSPSAIITVTAPAPMINIAGSSIAPITAGGSGTSTITVTPSNGFTGAVNLTCSVGALIGATSIPTCSYNPPTLTISGTVPATSTLTVATTSATTVDTYPMSISASDVATGMLNPQALLEINVVGSGVGSTPPGVALTPGPTAVTISSPGQSGTSTVSVTPTNYTGTLNLTCALATAPSGANATYNPTCAVPATLAISSSSVATTTASIATTAATSGALAYPETNRRTNRWDTVAGGAALACVLFFGIPARRRGWKSMLSLLVFLVAMAGVGCGGGGGGGGGNSGTPGTTAGTYTFTVTATDSKTSTITATGTVTVTVN